MIRRLLFVLMALMSGCAGKYYCARAGGPMFVCTDPIGAGIYRFKIDNVAPWNKDVVATKKPFARMKVRPWKPTEKNDLRLHLYGDWKDKEKSGKE